VPLIFLSIDETDVSAQRTQAQAEARLPGPHGDASRPRDPQAAPRPRAEAAVGLTPRATSSTLVQRRHRLSRSRDFDAVYRQGKSVSTRFLVLYWFERHDDREEAPRVGIAVPRKVGGAVVRNKVKRRLREAWRSHLERIPQGRDYVLVARPGLAESAETQGFEWLVERVGEALGKATP
jgi:ribonuclease P protein component